MENNAELKTYAGEDRVVPTSELRAIVDLQAKGFSLNTGISILDGFIEGVEAGELIIVSGKTKNGKTTLLYTLTRNFLERKGRTLWFSYEVPPRQFLHQLGAVESYVPLRLVSNAMDWILRRYIEAKLKYGCQIVMIDHLHYLVDLVRARNPAVEIGAIVRSLKRIAVEMGVIIFLVSHVRNVPRDMDATEDDLRDSGLTKAEADSTWIIARMRDKKTGIAGNDATLTVANHRRTGVMGRKVPLVKVGLYFEQREEEINSTEEISWT